MAVRGDNLIPPLYDFLRGQFPPAEEEEPKSGGLRQFGANKVEKRKVGVFEEDSGEQGEEEDLLETEQLRLGSEGIQLVSILLPVVQVDKLHK